MAHETKPAPLPAPVFDEPKPEKRKVTTAQQPFKRRDLIPRAGEKYWQIAAYGPRSLDAYLKTLEQQGIHPFVGPGPSENIYRILIGPLANADAVEQTRHLIQSLGIEPILRAY
jgi:cell division septation protein DedD